MRQKKQIIQVISPSSVYTFAKTTVKDKISKYNFSDKPYLGYHEVGKDGVVVASTILGFSFAKQGKDALEQGAKGVGEKIETEIKKDIQSPFFSSILGLGIYTVCNV